MVLNMYTFTYLYPITQTNGPKHLPFSSNLIVLNMYTFTYHLKSKLILNAQYLYQAVISKLMIREM